MDSVIGIERLSARQAEILAQLAKGRTNEEIAVALLISPATVRTHITAVLRLMEVTNRTEAAGLYLRWQARRDQLAQVLERPAVAVLPVQPLSADPRVDLVASGITCDIGCLFARYRSFPVIAHDSVRGLAPLAAASHSELGRQLRARFLVGGTLRSRGGRWRLVAYLDDADSHERLWNERYDFADSELFDVQDEVVERIVASAYAVLIAQLAPGPRDPTQDDGLTAWTIAHAGMAAFASRDADGCRTAAGLFTQALTRDPALVLAHFGLGLTSYAEVLNQWGTGDAARDRLATCAERCATLSPHAAEGHFLWARHSMIHDDLPAARLHLEGAVDRNPSFAMAHALLAQVLQLSGHAEPAMVAMRHAVRLGPRSFVAGLATMHFVRAEYAEALDEACRALVIAPTYAYARMIAAAAAWWLGDMAQAVVLHGDLVKARPDFAPAVFVATFGPRVEGVQRVQQALEALDARRLR